MAINLSLGDWKTNALFSVLGAIVGGPIGLAAGAALGYARHVYNQKGGPGHDTSAPAGFENLTAPPSPALSAAASAFLLTKPELGASKGVMVDGKAYLLRTELHPEATAGEHGGVTMYQRSVK